MDDIVTYSDHYLVTCTLQTKVKLTEEATKILCYRKFSSLNIENFKADIMKTELNKVNETTFKSCDDACKFYNLTLLKLSDKHCPIFKKKLFKKHEQWFDEQLRETRRLRRKAENNMRSSF